MAPSSRQSLVGLSRGIHRDMDHGEKTLCSVAGLFGENTIQISSLVRAVALPAE